MTGNLHFRLMWSVRHNGTFPHINFVSTPNVNFKDILDGVCKQYYHTCVFEQMTQLCYRRQKSHPSLSWMSLATPSPNASPGGVLPYGTSYYYRQGLCPGLPCDYDCWLTPAAQLCLCHRSAVMKIGVRRSPARVLPHKTSFFLSYFYFIYS